MSILRGFYLHLPQKSQVVRVFLTIIAPIYLWALIIFFRELPSYIMRLSTWDILGIFSYVLLIALTDALLLTLVLIIITIFLPLGMLQERFVSTATVLGYMAVIAFLPFVLQNGYSMIALYASKSWFWGLWFIVIVAVSVFLLFLNVRSSRFRQTVLAFVDKVAVLSTVYLFVSAVGIVVILARLFGIQ